MSLAGWMCIMWFEHNTVDKAATDTPAGAGAADATDFDYIPYLYAHEPYSHWHEGCGQEEFAIWQKRPRHEAAGLVVWATAQATSI